MRNTPDSTTTALRTLITSCASAVMCCVPSSVVLLCSAYLFVCLSCAFGQSHTGQIQGQVIDEKNNQPLVGQKVYLTIHKGGEAQNRETITIKDGTYLFDSLSIGVDTFYSVSTVHEGKEYIETDLVLSTWIPSLKVNIEILQSTDDSSRVIIRQHTIIISPPPEDHASGTAVSVMEIVQVENTNDLDFQTVLDGQPVGLHLNLPNGHEGIQFDATFTKHLRVKSNQLVSDQPLASGVVNSGFSYIMHVDNSVLDLSRVLTFTTNQIYVFVADGISFIPQSSIFGSGRRERIHEIPYTIYATNPVNSLSSGQTPKLSFAFARGASSVAPQQDVTNGNRQRSRSWMIVLIAVAAASAGGFLVAAIFLVKSGADQCVEPRVVQDVADVNWLNTLDSTDLAHARLTGLEMITHLDTMYEKKEISEKVYNRLRKEQADRLEYILEKAR